jgi:hypothetical protein
MHSRTRSNVPNTQIEIWRALCKKKERLNTGQSVDTVEGNIPVVTDKSYRCEPPTGDCVRRLQLLTRESKLPCKRDILVTIRYLDRLRTPRETRLVTSDAEPLNGRAQPASCVSCS